MKPLARKYWYLAPFAVAAILWVWLALASFIFLQVRGFPGDFAFPYDQIIDASVELQKFGFHNFESFQTAVAILSGALIASMPLIFLAQWLYMQTQTRYFPRRRPW